MKIFYRGNFIGGCRPLVGDVSQRPQFVEHPIDMKPLQRFASDCVFCRYTEFQIFMFPANFIADIFVR